MAKKSEMPITAKILVWARETVGLTQQAAADKLGFKLEKLELLERGDELPSYSQLKKIGTTYKRPTPVFFLEEVPTEPPPPKDFRVIKGKATVKLAPSTLVAIRSVYRRRENALELMEAQNSDLIPFTHATTLNSNPEDLGKLWRDKFALLPNQKFTSEYDAFNTWKSAVEAEGVLVFQESLKTLEELRGLAVYEKILPAILLNSKDSVRGRIFSLLHEYCHLLLKTSGIGSMNMDGRSKSTESPIEIFCNAFAGAALVPLDLLLSDPAVRASNARKPIDFRTLFRLSNRFQASQEVILRRLLKVGKITADQYENSRLESEKHFQAIKTKGKKSKVIIPVPRKAISKNGRPFTELVLRGIRRGTLTEARGSQYLGVKHQHLPQIRKLVTGYQGD